MKQRRSCLVSYQLNRIIVALVIIALILLAPTLAYGAPDGVWGDWIIDRQPTCTQPGEEHHVALQGNGAIEYAEIPALGHNYVATITKQPTDTEPGIKTYTCTRCGDSYTESIPALGHDFKLVITPPTDTQAGLKTYICVRCGYTYTEPGAPALGHDFGPWTTEVPAKVGVEGLESRVCRRCGEKQTRAIPALSAPATPVAAPPVPPVKSGFPNVGDYVFSGCSLTLLGVFAALLIPYFQGLFYLRRQRRMYAEIQDLREALARYYDFK